MLIMHRLFKYLSIFLFIGCSNQPDVNSLADLDKLLRSKPETFQIDPAKDNLLTCPEGTLVYFPANSLVLGDGNIPTGPVEIKIEEVQTVASMIGNNLSTTSNDKILETNGMLQIEAMSGSNTLKVNKDKSIVVMFPKQNKAGFKLFYGSRDSLNKVNWIPDKIDNTRPESSLENISPGNDTSLIKKVVTKVGGLAAEAQGEDHDYSITWKVNDPDSSIENHIEASFNKENILYDHFIKNDIHLKMDIYLDTKGKIKTIYFEDTTMYEKEITNLLKGLPAFDLKSMKRIDMTDPYALYIGVSSEVDKEKYLQRFNSKYKDYRDQAIQKVDNAELNYFIYSVTNLGWINCDRFPDIEEEKGDLMITTKAANETKIYLVFQDIKSIIQATKKGNTFVAENIPEGQNIKIIAIGYEDKKPFIAIEKIKVSKKRSIDISNYKEFTLDNLKQELN